MFPNYCFTENPREHNYMLQTRQYPKATPQSSTSSKTRYSPRSKKSIKKRCSGGYTPKDIDFEKAWNKIRKCQRSHHRPSRSVSRSPSTRSMHEEQEKCIQSRSVNFQLTNQTPNQKLSKKSFNESLNQNEREAQRSGGGEETQPKTQYAAQNETHRQLQESCADFLNIVHDNVLETVQKTVERMFVKYFEDTVDKLQNISAQMVRNEALLSKMYLDLLDRINEQNDTSINQFKFIAQMFIEFQQPRSQYQHQSHGSHHNTCDCDESESAAQSQYPRSNGQGQSCHNNANCNIIRLSSQHKITSRSTAGDCQSSMNLANNTQYTKNSASQVPSSSHSCCCRYRPNICVGNRSRSHSMHRSLRSTVRAMKRLAKGASSASLPNIRPSRPHHAQRSSASPRRNSFLRLSTQFFGTHVNNDECCRNRNDSCRHSCMRRGHSSCNRKSHCKHVKAGPSAWDFNASCV